MSQQKMAEMPQRKKSSVQLSSTKNQKIGWNKNTWKHTHTKNKYYKISFCFYSVYDKNSPSSRL